MSSMRFLCQHCSQPLRQSQEEPQEEPPTAQEKPRDAQEDSGPATESTECGKAQAGASGSPLPNSCEVSEGGAGSFTLVGDMLSLGTLSSIQKATAGIFDILSGQRDVDHPLCEECTGNLLKQLDRQLAAAELEGDTYRRCLGSTLRLGEKEREAQQAALWAQLQGLELKEARLAQQLEEVDQGRARAAAELEAAQAQAEELRRQESQHLKDWAALMRQRLELEDQLRSVERRLRHAQGQLARLQRTSIFDATFAIWEDGPVGVINHFRLGRVPGVPVGWPEINAAWGQVTLLLLALCNTVRLRLCRYQPVACGSHSYLRTLTGAPEELPLFSDGRHSALLDNKFDRAMMAFLDCLQQFMVEAEKGEGGLRLPYPVHLEAGALEDSAGCGERCCIRTHLNTESQWTKALRLLLRNLERSLAWASLRYQRK